jgi:uncharacterized protein
MTGEPSFLEIGVPNGSSARDFWIETPTMRAGLHPNDDGAIIGVYFAVPDLDSAMERVRELGGEAEDRGPGDAEFGRFAECRDNQGVYFGLHQPPGAS